jgi:hypothetical protein
MAQALSKQVMGAGLLPASPFPNGCVRAIGRKPLPHRVVTKTKSARTVGGQPFTTQGL